MTSMASTADPAKVLLRLPRGLHEHLRETADTEGVSVNSLLIALLAGSSGWKREPTRRGRAARTADPMDRQSGRTR